MPNLRYTVRLVSAFLTRFKILIGLGILFGIIFFFVLKFLLPAFSGATTQKIGITGRYTPSTIPNSILLMIGDGLTKLSPDGSVEPGLATSWETPDKGKTWIFRLKDGLFWQDGKKVVSSDVLYQFSDVVSENPDDKTIVFKLQNPYSAFPSVVSKPAFKKGLLGTGSWLVKKLSLAGSYVDQISLQNKNGEKIIYKFYPTEERTKLAFQLGEVDEIKDVLGPSPFDTWKKAKIAEDVDTGEYVAVFFNNQDKILADKNIRQALSYAIDKDSLGQMRAISPISIDSWAYNPQVKPYSFDLEKAKGTISKLPSDVKDGLVINLTTAPVLLPTAEKIAKNWEALGIKVNLQVGSGIPTDYQAFLAIFDIPEDPDQYSIWHSTQTASNITHYQNPRIDKLLEDGRSQLDIEERRRTYLDFQRFLVEDSPAAFLYYPTTYTITR
ncbi:MAG TPA: ABC transporter substrate-binding protein [Patescibacteria group bacterium]|nr:ABC transporter substrate-binding protein [Patescibacteria group bacterium]